jgi:hypothetical protein
MNERIRELAESCTVDFVDGRGVSLSEIDVEKFAELIVKEYEKLLPEICPWTEADKEGPMKGWHVQFVARKHFGVRNDFGVEE